MSPLIVLGSGERILIRPIRRNDKDLLLDGLHRLSPQSQYRRFFSPKPKLSAAQLRYLTEVDHRTHEALVAIDQSSGDGIGVARFVRSSEHAGDAEAAVAVIDPWQDRRVGTALLEELAARAREEGVERFTASVLATNAPMLKLLRQFGDTTVVDRAAGVVELQIELRDAGIPDGLAHSLRGAARGELAAKPHHPTSP
ncbi:MAG TPA: GNAT family N-acetyltransferase [Solirubrobacteraceae bacterium]|nr:GNAT family N-acetyltransferase [Solirubrobacteraceae bacterium]